MYDLEMLEKDLRSRLSEYRFKHSVNVALVACELASIYGVDIKKAYLAGLVHDVAKEFSDEENEYYINKYNIPRFDVGFKKIIHSFVGAVYLKEKYDMDSDICNAVMYHTVGDENMDLLAKIVFVADKIEPGKDYVGIEEERIVARENIDEALIMCLENNKKKLEKNGKEMNDMSLKVLKKLKENRKRAA